jgi:hypothetical protein
VVTLGIALQVVGVVVVLFGAIVICVGGIPKKNVARAHGTYGGAQTIWRALGREHGYTKGGLSMTVLGGRSLMSSVWSLRFLALLVRDRLGFFTGLFLF